MNTSSEEEERGGGLAQDGVYEEWEDDGDDGRRGVGWDRWWHRYFFVAK